MKYVWRFKIVALLMTLTVGSLKADDKKALDNYYHEVFIGEKKTSNYFGPLDPRSNFSDSRGDLISFDDEFKGRYLNREIQEEPFSLHDFWFNEIVEKSNCPDTTLGSNIDYIRYLYRLVTMSYLFEGMKMNYKLSSELGDKNLCPISFSRVFEGCSPESNDMKKFYERVYGKFINEIDKTNYQSFSKKELQTWQEGFQKTTLLTTDPLFSRLHDWCISHQKNCRSLNVNEIKNALGDFCANDTKEIKSLCTEKDSTYGLNSIPTATDLIKASNAFNLINQSGMGEECLRRYGKLLQRKESSNALLVKQYPLIHAYLLKNNARYPQGELFLPGSLKEFDVKGLSDFLAALKPPKVEPIVIIKPRPKPTPKPAPAVAKVEEKKPEPAPLVVEVAPAPKPHVSEFETAVEELKTKGNSRALNMDAFHDDFEFTPTMIAELTGPIKKFQTRNALNDMKSYDLLGSTEAPVGLIFLKFLIDTENHQGLYNIITVLGDKFYVNNDIEKKTSPHYIQLKNDSSTNNRWQIILLKK